MSFLDRIAECNRHDPALYVPLIIKGQLLGRVRKALLPLAGLGTVGHLALTRAYVLAEASQLAPLDFTQLLAVAAIGFLAFSEVPDVWTWVGGAVIAGSAVYIARREAQVRRAGAAGGI